jgi:hypothetical protein
MFLIQRGNSLFAMRCVKFLVLKNAETGVVRLVRLCLSFDSVLEKTLLITKACYLNNLNSGGFRNENRKTI